MSFVHEKAESSFGRISSKKSREEIDSITDETLNLHKGDSVYRKASCACGGGCPNCQGANSNLTVSQPNDASEIEADRIAENVMRTSAPQTGNLTENKSSSLIQRKCDNCNTIVETEDINLQRKETANDTPAVSAKTSAQISSLQGSGESLPKHLREFFEPRFGYDFGSVKVHTNARAAESSKAVNALAYTVGRDVVFGQGQYQPETTVGKKLLAHELVHVVQQGKFSNETTSKIQRSIDTETSNPGGESNEAPITGEFPEQGEKPLRGGLVDKDPEAAGKAQSKQKSTSIQTLCFAISELTPNPLAQLFGSVAELIVNRDYCSQRGCSPFLVRGGIGTEYFDSTVGGAEMYIAFLGFHNSLSWLQLAELAIQSQISLNRPDILAHKSDRKDY